MSNNTFTPQTFVVRLPDKVLRLMTVVQIVRRFDTATCMYHIEYSEYLLGLSGEPTSHEGSPLSLCTVYTQEMADTILDVLAACVTGDLPYLDLRPHLEMDKEAYEESNKDQPSAVGHRVIDLHEKGPSELEPLAPQPHVIDRDLRSRFQPSDGSIPLTDRDVQALRRTAVATRE
jgi:hypothetical protein